MKNLTELKVGEKIFLNENLIHTRSTQCGSFNTPVSFNKNEKDILPVNPLPLKTDMFVVTKVTDKHIRVKAVERKVTYKNGLGKVGIIIPKYSFYFARNKNVTI